MTRHIFIPDTQVDPWCRTDHMSWVGEYMAEKHPDVVVQAMDHWDMPSLSSYDEGKARMEGRRYSDDVEAGNRAKAELTAPIKSEVRRLRGRWKPRLIETLGNHENRITRFLEDGVKWVGKISLDDLESPGWERHDFLEVVEVDGVSYCHYFYNPMTGRPYGGQSIDTRLKTIGHSFTMGHQQTLLFGRRWTSRGAHYGLVAGECYLHQPEYLGPQGNGGWKGIVVCNEVEDGSYDPMFVSLAYLCKKYEGIELNEWKRRNGIEER